MPEIDGYAGKFLRVDLTKGQILEEKIEEEVLRKYIGGTGIGIKLLYEEVPPEVQWFDPENILILATGPLNGTRIGGSGGFTVVTKGALTDGVTSAQANGSMGAYLKFCGFDGIIIKGVSERWVYLHIDDDSVELCDASHLMGKDTYETEDLIKEELGKKEQEMSVATIGPAGENLVKFAGIFADKGHAAPHNGCGAVLGSKNLKAIAVARGKIPVNVKEKGKLSEIADRLLNDVKTLDSKIYNWGTLWCIAQARKENWLPVKNYTTNVWQIDEDKLAKFQGSYIREHFKAKWHPCWGCQLHHIHMLRIPDGPYAGETMEEPDYEQLASWGPIIGNTEIDAALMLSKEVDRLGMDTNEAGWVISLVMECYEKKILAEKDLDGLDMTWGSVDETRRILNKIAWREGIGNILAEGVLRASKRIGGNAADLAICTKKGSTPRSHDHRVRLWEMFDTCVSNTGTLEGPMLGAVGPQEWKELSTALAKAKGRMQFEDSMVTCRFNTRTNVELLSQAVSAVTGWEFTFGEAIEVGQRIVSLMRAFDMRHGLTSDLEYPSPRYSSPPSDGPLKGVSLIPYWKKMLGNYYGEMGWDEKTGKPLPQTLKKLGLEHVIDDIWREKTS